MVRSPAVSVPNGVLAGRRDDGLVSRLPVLRAALEQQRHFRRGQLDQVDGDQRTHRSPRTNGAADQDPEAVLALREVEVLVKEGARRALTDIELALAQMRTGRYGYCRMCGIGIPLVVLEAIPKTTLCLACHRFSERAENQPSAPDSITPSAAEPAREVAR